MSEIFFLPGAGASASFWLPVAQQLGQPHRLFSWPGLGAEPEDPRVKGMDDLVARVLAEMREPVDLVAQSMGGIVALRVALAAPQKVRRLVLAVTSGGVPMDDLMVEDWRRDYFATFPKAGRWIGCVQEDLSAQLGQVRAPALLVWGDADPISPVAAGQRLAGLLPDARLEIIPGGGHDLARTHVAEVSGHVHRHLAGPG